MVAEFDIKAPDNRVEYDIWYSSSNDVALDFIQDFKKIDQRFGEDVLMTPRFVFWECLQCDEEFLELNCLGGGRYCGTEASNDQLPGREIVLEDIRQICIYKWSYFTVNDRSIFWDYVKEIHQECNGYVNEDCSQVAHDRVPGLDWEATEKCVNESFTNPDPSTWKNHNVNNTLIDKDFKYWAKYGTSLFPSIVINNQTFRG